MKFEHTRILLINKITELNEIRDKYSLKPSDEVIGDGTYTYGEHIKYLSSKINEFADVYNLLMKEGKN